MAARKRSSRKRSSVPPEVSKYFSKIGKKGGSISVDIVNANLTHEQRVEAGKKAAAALTPDQRKQRARKAAKARWKTEKRKKAGS
jgi:hypothetical protein